MGVQLQLNQGPQDALLYDNTKSYFTNVGYVRSSNFQVEYKDVDSQNTPGFGTTVQFIIPKAADLLGPVDFICELEPTSDSSSAKTTDEADFDVQAWIDQVGYAMIDKVTFTVGSTDIETISGEQLSIVNEVMKDDESRLSASQILKTGMLPASLGWSSGKPTLGAEYTGANVARMLGHQYGSTSAVDTAIGQIAKASGATAEVPVNLKGEYSENSRIIAYRSGVTNAKSAEGGCWIYTGKKRLIIPLGLFFTKHPSNYFPLAAIAGCNDVRITIRFRPLNQLLITATSASTKLAFPNFANNGFVSGSAKLRCHYVHVTGPEASTLMNKEHVRLLKLWHSPNYKIFTPEAGTNSVSLDLSFLHPVITLVVTLRANSEIDNAAEGVLHKGYFNYHGDGKDTIQGLPGQRITVEAINLSLNGVDRHSSLSSSAGIPAHYLRNRLMPMLHSNASVREAEMAYLTPTGDGQKLADMINIAKGASNIFVFPISIAPEGVNPAGAVNFSKVSHAKLSIQYSGMQGFSASAPIRVDVHALYYNWLQVKDGRALVSFA